MNRQRVKFPGAFGSTLVGRIELPDPPGSEPAAYALFAHCFTCSKDLKAAGWISRALVERGIAVFRFDFTGIGESAGDFADTDFSSNLDDLEAAADFLRREREAPQILIGHSLGGAAVLAAAERVPEVRAVATIAAPSDTDHLRDTLIRLAPELEERDEAEVTLAGRKFRIKRQLLQDLAAGSLQGAIAGLGRALLIFHSPVDSIVGIDHARRIYEAAKHPKSFISLDAADHLLTAERDARYVGEVLAAWAGRYISLRSAQTATEEEITEQGEVLVTGGPAGFAQEIYTRRHRLLADEPASFGGTDTGPSPYELLLASLGACTSMTLRLYADRKQWSLDGVRVRLAHHRVHAEDCELCTDDEREGGGKIDRITRKIEILGELGADQRDRLLEIAERCPVHRTLTGTIKISSELA
ncbi:MAG TPA: alpha/beta fold hydrolase [Thermoanaerobaculia bacterium]|nr:alpha/beta fold hydrolase [Thermoanaerobaculia bacterium]